MRINTRIRDFITKYFKISIYKKDTLPIGSNIFHDLKYKLKLDLNVILDVGANIGQTAFKWHHYYPNAWIYSFEPIKESYDILHKSTKHISNIQCYPFALGESNQNIEIHPFDKEASVFNSIIIENQNLNNDKKESIQIVRGDDFCKEKTIKCIDLLKIDTEGYELKVLEGFEDYIKEHRIKTIFCEVGFHQNNTRNTYINDIISYCNDWGFVMYGLYNIENRNIKENMNFGNLLFIHKKYL